MTTYEEWRVTGTLTTIQVAKVFRTETEARAYMGNLLAAGPLGDGPHLHKRVAVVHLIGGTVTDWEEA